jgi:hypothetical protein
MGRKAGMGAAGQEILARLAEMAFSSGGQFLESYRVSEQAEDGPSHPFETL